MALEQKLQLRMSQRLIMTPSLQQAIKLLQMSKLDLLEEINHELEDNPALEEGNLEGHTEEPPAETQESLSLGLALGVFGAINVLLAGIAFGVWWLLKKRRKSAVEDADLEAQEA